ncbi:hypothetical protein Q5692_04100 [Microcoleus sp. C2C3]|uniref:hypothetical protein n=1 Tax=unclassified Microcoleus TaxID=2642155 RepID=UPI002FCF11E4
MMYLKVDVLLSFIAEGRSPMEVGRRKKEEVVIAMVSAIKNVLTVLAVAIEVKPSQFTDQYQRFCTCCQNNYAIFYLGAILAPQKNDRPNWHKVRAIALP